MTERKYGPPDALESPRFTGIRTFARLPHVRDDLRGVDAAVVGIPFDTGGTFRVGARFAPEAVRSASALLRPYNEAGGIAVFDHLSVVDYGDLAIVPGYIEESLRRIEEGFRPLLEADVTPVAIGGDHSVTLGELRAYRGRGEAPALIQFDSHSDTSQSYFGKPFTHGTPFWHAAQEGLIDPSRSVQIGLRGPIYSAADYEVPVELGFEVITAREVHRIGIDALVQRIRERVGDASAFLTFDIDFLDPAYAPATGTPEIGGFTSTDAQELIRGLAGMSFCGFDLVEVLPEYDVSAVTSVIAANVIYEFLTLLALRQREGRK
jgi:agmatinase